MFFKTAPRFWEKCSFSQEPVRYLAYTLMSIALLPFAWIYGLLVWVKQIVIDTGLMQMLGLFQAAPVPIIIVGNVRVGGTGKTPLVIALANALLAEGWRPGVISRGYLPHRKTSLSVPQGVFSDSDPNTLGDEPVLMAQRMHEQIPIWVFPKRKTCIDALLKAHPEVNVIISDDGLQHAGLVRWPARDGGRDLELVIEDERGIGNGRLLPAGPLRESAKRERDATILMGKQLKVSDQSNNALSPQKSFGLIPEIKNAYPLGRMHESHSITKLLTQQAGLKIAAIAAIGNPHKFFNALTNLGIHLDRILSLPDHAQIQASDIAQINADYIFITEKDAVKCRSISDERIWVVPLELSLPIGLTSWVNEVIRRPSPYSK